MKIALVTETFPPEVNGVAMTLHRLVIGLAVLGHELTVVRPRQKSEARRAGEGPYAEIFVKGFPLPSYPGLQFGAFAGRPLRAAWAAQRPDLVHIATEGPLGYSTLKLAQQMGIATISTFHTNFHRYANHYGFGLFAKPLMAYFRWFHNATGATYVPSEEVRHDLEKRGIGNLRILSRGVDTTLFTPDKRSAALRASWGAEEDSPVVLYVGRVANEKNLPLTVRAFLRFRELQPKARMVIIGDGPERRNLERAHPEIHFAGMQRGENLATHYASGDFFFFASVTETFGNVVTEAMASGLVVLSYNYAAGKCHILDGENGFTAPYEDEAAYLQGVERIHEASARWPELRKAARKTATEVSWERIIGVFEAQLCEIVRNGKG